nr:hypothetical protein [Tessaracoccus coleopterorum]
MGLQRTAHHRGRGGDDRWGRGARDRPAGASTGRREAIELRDGGRRMGGLGVREAVRKVAETLAPALRGMPVTDQEAIDAILDAADPDPQRSGIGGNTTTAVSMAVAHAGPPRSACRCGPGSGSP